MTPRQLAALRTGGRVLWQWAARPWFFAGRGYAITIVGGRVYGGEEPEDREWMRRRVGARVADTGRAALAAHGSARGAREE